MQPKHHGPLQSAGLRIAGMALLTLSAFAVSRLFHMVHTVRPHDATPAEMAFAAVVFFGGSGGALLLLLGAHIFDKVQISARWEAIGTNTTAVSGQADQPE